MVTLSSRFRVFAVFRGHIFDQVRSGIQASARWFHIGFLGMLCGISVFAQNRSEPKTKTAQGLQATFYTGSGESMARTPSDIAVLPNVALYIPSKSPPTPFLPGGPFTLIWSGFVSLDLRSEYSFQAELNGSLKLEINGVPVLDASGAGELSSPGRFVRLNKGTNALVATFRSPDKGDAFVRLSWIPKAALPAPMPLNALTHATDEPNLQQAAKLRLGRDLFAEYRCIQCHATAIPEGGMIELTRDAPSFDGIGSRRNYDWLVRWILDPKTERHSARMPRFFHGDKAEENAAATAAYLASLKLGGSTRAETTAAASDAETGKQLFETLHCAACHHPPDGTAVDAKRISLKHVNRKFTSGMLAVFLKSPEAHYAWTRMPNFRLSDDEAAQLAAFLQRDADPLPNPQAFEPTTVERGKQMIQTTGCLNCHAMNLENKFSAKSLKEIAVKQQQGCLAPVRPLDSKAPDFAFSPEERAALQLFISTDASSLARHNPADFASRKIRSLNCMECHGKFEGFPPLEILGGKLKPEWSKAFIAGEIADKPRPWLPAIMPAFGKYAEPLARGLATLHGYPPRTPAEPSTDQELVRIGQKLVATDGGFACVACHSIGNLGANQVFESAGINLAYSGERLLKPYFVRWLFNPLGIDPASKMPVYFDEQGKSPLTDVFDGDGAKQIEALWQHIRLGRKMPPPHGLEAPP